MSEKAKDIIERLNRVLGGSSAEVRIARESFGNPRLAYRGGFLWSWRTAGEMLLGGRQTLSLFDALKTQNEYASEDPDAVPPLWKLSRERGSLVFLAGCKSLEELDLRMRILGI